MVVLAGQLDDAGIPEMSIQAELDDLCCMANTLKVATADVGAAVLRHHGNHLVAMEVRWNGTCMAKTLIEGKVPSRAAMCGILFSSGCDGRSCLVSRKVYIMQELLAREMSGDVSVRPPDVPVPSGAPTGSTTLGAGVHSSHPGIPFKRVFLHLAAHNVPGSHSLQHLLMLMQEMMQVMSLTLKGGGQA
jgi:hypothetical protein